MRVLIVDDHPLYREGLKALLAGLDPDVEPADAASVDEALQLADPANPIDLVLLDMNLPGTNRLEALRQVRAAFENTPVVIVSGDEDAELVHQTIDCGASGYIPKSTDPGVTIHALRLVLAHGVYLPPSMIARRSTLVTPEGPPPAEEPMFSGRQREVLLRLLQGKSNKMIARDLDIAEGTVKAHLFAVYQMLGVNSRAQAMFRVHELGLLDAVR